MLRGSVTTLGLAAGGVLFSGNPAQALDLYNPFSGYPITDTWQDHLDRGSLGGIDFGMGVGTALPACGAGSSRTFPTTAPAGTRSRSHHADGYRSQYLHLSQFLLANGTSVGAGAIVGRSGGAVGAPGSGSSTGPHVHWHMITPGARA